MNKEYIAIVVPVYNVEHYLKRCIDSILNQSYEYFRLYIVNDGSTDSSADICKEYALKDERVIYTYQENQGLSGARNTGIDAAIKDGLCKWITFIDSDDWIHSRFLEVLINACINHKVKISVSGFTRKSIPETEINDQFIGVIQSDVLFQQYNVNATVAWGKIYDLSLFENVRYPIGKLHEDEFVTYRLLDVSKTVFYCNLPLYYYYLNPKSIMNSSWNERRLDSLEAFHNQIQYYKSVNKPDLVKYSCRKYINGLAYHYKMASKSIMNDESKNTIQRELRRKLRCALLCNSCLPLNHDTSWMYEIAFPKYMEYIYWKAERLKKKIRHVKLRISEKNHNRLNRFFCGIKDSLNRKRLKNKDMSLLSSNCNGCLILHDLNIPFRSPFVNLWLKPSDFIKYTKEIDKYNAAELMFDEVSGFSYPVAKLLDITIYFQHYKTQNDAVDAWERRKKRINKNNLFLMMTDRDGCTYQDLLNFDSLEYPKVVFTHRYYPDIRSAQFVPGFEDSNQVGNLFEFKSAVLGVKYYDCFDYVKWFNSRLISRRER